MSDFFGSLNIDAEEKQGFGTITGSLGPDAVYVITIGEDVRNYIYSISYSFVDSANNFTNFNCSRLSILRGSLESLNITADALTALDNVTRDQIAFDMLLVKQSDHLQFNYLFSEKREKLNVILWPAYLSGDNPGMPTGSLATLNVIGQVDRGGTLNFEAKH